MQGCLKMFVSYQWSIVIADKSNIRNNEFIEKPIPAHPSCRLDSLVALRNIYLLLFVIPETPCIPLQSLWSPCSLVKAIKATEATKSPNLHLLMVHAPVSYAYVPTGCLFGCFVIYKIKAKPAQRAQPNYNWRKHILEKAHDSTKITKPT